VTAPLRIARAICESGSNLFNRLRRHSRVALVGRRGPAKFAPAARRVPFCRAGRRTFGPGRIWELAAFFFQIKNSIIFRNIQEDVCLFAIDVIAQGIKASHPDSVDRCSWQAKFGSPINYTVYSCLINQHLRSAATGRHGPRAKAIPERPLGVGLWRPTLAWGAALSGA
jgi:hypothetical protein